MNDARLVPKPYRDPMPEQARDARALAWAFVFRCWEEKQEGGPETAPDDAKKESKHVRATTIIPDQT